MPSFYDSVAEADRWALTDYIYSLGDGDKASYATLLVASPLDEELDLSRGASLFEGAPPSRFPIVGQIMEPGRQLSPPVTTVVVRAVFDQRRIVFLVRSTSGVSFAEGAYVPIAFSVWDGLARERGNRRGLTQWFYVYVPPRERPSVVGPMLKAALGVLGLEVLALILIRRTNRPAG